MVRSTLRTVDDTVLLKWYASRGKYARAEPVSSLYERGKVKHLKYLEREPPRTDGNLGTFRFSSSLTV